MSDLIFLIHVLAGAMWFGGHVYVEALMASAGRTRDQETAMTISVRAAATNGRIFGIAGIVVLVTGIWTVLITGYEFEMLFVSIGMVFTLVALGIGFFFLKPREDQLVELAAENGLTNPQVMENAKTVGMMNHIMTLLVTISIILMALKPGGF